MRRVNTSISLCAAVITMVALSFSVSTGLASYVERVTGVVQDWSVERGYLVVDGVRYEFGEGMYLVDRHGQLIPLGRLTVGARVSLLEHDGAVIEIALLGEER